MEQKACGGKPVYHVPIMVEEVLALLEPQRGGVFVDGTLGGGGHSEAILKTMPAGSVLYGIDRDADAHKEAGERLKPYGSAFVPLYGNFFDMKMLLAQVGVTSVDGILLDLGVSSHQLDEAERGFSYKTEARLDMRMDRSSSTDACAIVNGYPEAELVRIFRDYGEERFSGRIARAIIQEREKTRIESTTVLAGIIANAIPAKFRNEPQHPARRCFQALRIEVNGELDGLKEAIIQAHDLLNPKGRLVILSFHSLEDRIVKNCFKDFEDPCTCPKSLPMCVCGKKPTAHVLTRKPQTADQSEQNRNSRSAPAKLRAIERL